MFTEVKNIFLAEQHSNGSFKCYDEDLYFNILRSYEVERDGVKTSYIAHEIDTFCGQDNGDFGEYQACIVNGRTKDGLCGMVCEYGDQLTVLPPELMCDGVRDCKNITHPLDVTCSHQEHSYWCRSENGSNIEIPESYICDGSIHYCNSESPERKDEDRWECGTQPGSIFFSYCRHNFIHPSKFCDGVDDCQQGTLKYDERSCNQKDVSSSRSRLCEDSVTREVKYLYAEQICGNPAVYTGEFAPKQEFFRPCFNKLDQLLCDKSLVNMGGLQCILNKTLKTYLKAKIDSFFYIDRSYESNIDVNEPQWISRYLLCDGETDCEDAGLTRSVKIHVTVSRST